MEEATLAQNIFTLRKALGDGTNGREYIETVPKRGYRFVAPVKVAEEQEVGTHRKPTTIRGPLSQWLLWVAPVFLVAIVSVGIYLRGRPHGPASTTGPAKVMLAVLPFENLSGDAKQEYFSDGLATTAARRPGRTRP